MGEPIPGLAATIRLDLRRRNEGNQLALTKINTLTDEQIYAQANPTVLAAIEKAKPSDPSDIRQWEQMQQAIELYLTRTERELWLKNLTKKYSLSTRAKR